jgi:adhesin HecA-like repeat protein
VDVLRPKVLDTHPGDKIMVWARGQLEIAGSILDNPGGGLLFATQTVGQVKSGLRERDPERWEAVAAILDRVEDAAVRREFVAARELLDESIKKLGST